MKKLPAEVQKLQVLVVHENVEIMYESSWEWQALFTEYIVINVKINHIVISI